MTDFDKGGFDKTSRPTNQGPSLGYRGPWVTPAGALTGNEILLGVLGTTDLSIRASQLGGGVFFNVQDPTYGAVCDGVTNDTAAVNRAIVAANASGNGQVVVPSGKAILVGGDAGPVQMLSNVWFNGLGATMIAAPTLTIRPNSGGIVTGLVQIGGPGLSVSQSYVTDFKVQDKGFTNNDSNFVSMYESSFDVGVERCYITNGSKVGIVVGANVLRAVVCDNRIFQTIVGGTAKTSILFTSSGGTPTYGRIERNYCEGASPEFAGNNHLIAHNIVTGWADGGGLVTEQLSDTHSLKIIGNTIYAGTGPNPCIENWAARTIIAYNTCHDNAGSGIDCGGQGCVVANNMVFDNGITQPGPGINARYDGATFNANNSVFIGNHSFNTTGAGGTQTYGYGEQAGGLSGVRLYGNNFNTNNTGDMNFAADSNTIGQGARPVARLPAAAANKGERMVVTDATVTTFASIVAGGGANTVPVLSDGTNWRIG